MSSLRLRLTCPTIGGRRPPRHVDALKDADNHDYAPLLAVARAWGVVAALPAGDPLVSVTCRTTR
jgi:hypothetical protein